MNISQHLAKFASELTFGCLPNEVRGNINIRIMDYISSAIAGNRVNRQMNTFVFSVLKQQSGNTHSSLLLHKGRLSAAHAAFYNAFIANGADMDDGHMLANGHPGIAIIPPVLAIAEWRGYGYEQIATAIVAGYEVFIRVSKAIMPSHLQRGFNGTGTVGAIAGAAAAARVLNLNAEKTHNAIGLAATSASGLMELNKTGQAMKPINPGNAAYSGVLCALFAEAGTVGPDAPLDGSNGFFKAFTDEVSQEQITKNLGIEFLLDSAYFKLYPACRHMHAMIDCAVALNKEGGFIQEEIDKLVLYTYPVSEKLTALIRHPKSEDEAKFSLTYATAVALRTANFTLNDLTSAAQKGDEIASLIDRMEIVVDPELENRDKMIRGARLELMYKNGAKRLYAVDAPKGEKQFPMTWEDTRKKLANCAEGVIATKLQQRIFEMVMSFETITDVSSLFQMLASEG